MKTTVSIGSVPISDVRYFKTPTGLVITVNTPIKRVESSLGSTTQGRSCLELSIDLYLPVSGRQRYRTGTAVRLFPTTGYERKLFSNGWFVQIGHRYGGLYLVTPRLTGREIGRTLYEVTQQFEL